MRDYLTKTLNKTFGLFNLKKRVESHWMRKHDSSLFIRPFVTVAREPGSGGAVIAQAVAEKLGFEFIDKQLVEEIAHSVKRRKELIESLDEKARSAVENLVDSVLDPEYVNEEKYVSMLFKLIITYAHRGRVVILGRGANFITPFAKGLHVNVIAPYSVRVERAMDFEGLNREKAKEVIARIEKERSDFVKKYINNDIKKRNAYDLTLNTTYFRISESRDIIVEAFRQKFLKNFKK